MTLSPDATDRAILRLLARDATRSAAEIGRQIGLTQPATWRRIKRLTEAGVIAGRRVVVDQAALGFGVTVFLGIRLAAKGRTSLDEFERILRRRIMTLPGVGQVEANVMLSEERRPGPL